MLDLLALARKYHLPLQSSGPRCRDGWVQLQCPFCGSGGTHGGWYLGYGLERGNFHCWRCGSLRFWEVIEAVLHCSHSQAIEIVRAHQRDGPIIPAAAIKRLRTIAPPKGTNPMQYSHRRYLEHRGFMPNWLEDTYDLRGTGHTGDAWAWRVIIPIKDEDGRVVAYQGRSIGDALPKYKMTEDAKCLEDPDTLLYGLDRCSGDSVVVVEGVTGVWRIGDGCVATFGIDWKRPQANLLRRFTNRYILFDPEPLAQKRAQSLAELLSIYPGETAVLEGFSTDPGELTAKQVERIRAETGLSGVGVR